MTLSIHNPEAGKLAHILADMRGVSLDDAVLDALQASIFREKNYRVNDVEKRVSVVMNLVKDLEKTPTYDTRTPDEILGYNENGCFD